MASFRPALAALVLVLAAPAYAAAPENTVVWYSSVDAKALAKVVQRFEQLHPGITVQALQIGSTQIPARVMTEQAGGRFGVDVVSGDEFSISQLAEVGALQPYRVPDPEKFVKGSLDPRGLYAPLYDDTTVIAWNPAKLKADGLKPPASLADLAKPEWRGKIAVDGSAFNWYSGTLQAHPELRDVFKKIAENKPFITTGHTVTIAQLEAGEFDATPTAYGYMAEHEKRLGRPVDYLNPRPLVVGIVPIGLVKNAPHPAAARTLMGWLLSREGQQYVLDVSDRPSARLDVKNIPAVFDPKQPYVVVRAPNRTSYTALVAEYKNLFALR